MLSRACKGGQCRLLGLETLINVSRRPQHAQARSIHSSPALSCHDRPALEHLGIQSNIGLQDKGLVSSQGACHEAGCKVPVLGHGFKVPVLGHGFKVPVLGHGFKMPIFGRFKERCKKAAESVPVQRPVRIASSLLLSYHREVHWMGG